MNIEPGLRRSNRERCAPIKYWKNEIEPISPLRLPMTNYKPKRKRDISPLHNQPTAKSKRLTPSTLPEEVIINKAIRIYFI